MAFTRYRTKAIFLREDSRGEADLLFTAFTEQFGKLKVLGKGIRKISSKLRPSAQVFYFSEIEFIQGRYYKTLTDAVLIDKFESTRQSPEVLDTAFRICHVLDDLTEPEQKDQKIWQLLLEVFRLFENWKLKIESSLKVGNWELKTIYLFFFWNLVAILGYQPRFSKQNNPLHIIAEGAEGNVEQLRSLEKRTKDYFQRLKNL